LTKIKKNQTAVLTKLYAIHTKYKNEAFDIKERTVRSLEYYMDKRFEKLLARHSAAWEELWERERRVWERQKDTIEDMGERTRKERRK